MFEYNNDFINGEMTCDYCENLQVFDGWFGECINQSKTFGWIIKKINYDWFHFCSNDCYNNYKKKYSKAKNSNNDK